MNSLYLKIKFGLGLSALLMLALPGQAASKHINQHDPGALKADPRLAPGQLGPV
jgi:hypothetical protein